MYWCLGARAGVTLPQAGAELRRAAAALGCGFQCEPCEAAVSFPQGTRAQPELPLEPGMGTAAVASSEPSPATTSSGHRAGAGQGSPGCCSMWEPEPARTGGEGAKGTLPEASLEKMENPLLLFPQLNISASKDKPYHKVMKSAIKEEPHKASKPG